MVTDGYSEFGEGTSEVRSLVRPSIVFFLVIIFRIDTSLAQISPGELSRPHAELEGISNCIRCHDSEERLPGDRCLDCHGEIKIQFHKKRGFHWRITKNKQERNCGFCHAEHNGREYELVYWDEGIEAFDHDQTGFALDGKHLERKCRDCHQRDLIVKELKNLNPDLNLDRTFLGLVHECASCHRDVHRAQFDHGCQECHGVESWHPALLFVHDRSSYTLTGKHLSTPCEKCHSTISGEVSSEQGDDYVRYVGLKYEDCSSCHEYRHKSKLRIRCDECHTTESWKSVDNRSFDHAKTRFVLRGRHSKLSCKSCHRTDNRRTTLEFEHCTSCHRDVHLDGFRSEKYTGRCEQCHGEDSFIPSTFGLEAHDQGPYPLTGAHRAVPCTFCHKREPGSEQITFRMNTEKCSSCHRDQHHGQFRRESGSTGCESCHSTSRWDSLDFDHQKTAFPLDGRHVNVRCEACHPMVETSDGINYVQYTSLDRSCQSCHAGKSDEFFDGENQSTGGTGHEND